MKEECSTRTWLEVGALYKKYGSGSDWIFSGTVYGTLTNVDQPCTRRIIIVIDETHHVSASQVSSS